MPITVWRVCGKKHANSAFSGKGSSLTTGRWHDHQKIVYTSSSSGTAGFELLCHIGTLPPDLNSFFSNFVLIKAEIPDEVTIDIVDPSLLEPDWDSESVYIDSNREITTQWLNKKESAVLQVPSALMGNDPNYLLNPEHGDFSKIIIHKPTKLKIPQRFMTLLG